ncbi:Lrp/AsnC family transcriptional regulator [Streptomyces sp. NPDC014622]|uniref:Lrp/AsnC family transcriptional regulator n=1 Tax=Streptomyces sp. NPDC014622 TaxID=3364874 RepID=UPI0036F4DF7F
MSLLSSTHEQSQNSVTTGGVIQNSDYHPQSPSATEALGPERARLLDEMDVALVDALQTSPRAPWSRIGEALGVDGTTAARRWDQLSAQGLAWITAYEEGGEGCSAQVELRCRAGAVAELTRALCARPDVASVERVAGGFDLLLTVIASSGGALARVLTDEVGRMNGVLTIGSRLVLRMFREGSDWRMRALDRDQRSLLADGATRRGPGRGSADLDRRLLEALAADGRRSFASLASDTGVSEATARRRVRAMLTGGRVRLRCDLAQPLSGWPVAATYRLNVPPGDLDRAGSVLTTLPEVRMCAAVSGDCNLLVVAWTRTMAEVPRFEVRLGERCPDAVVADRTVTLYTAKRMGRLLDTAGRATGHVPIKAASYSSPAS